MEDQLPCVFFFLLQSCICREHLVTRLTSWHQQEPHFQSNIFTSADVKIWTWSLRIVDTASINTGLAAARTIRPLLKPAVASADAEVGPRPEVSPGLDLSSGLASPRPVLHLQKPFKKYMRKRNKYLSKWCQGENHEG